MLGLPPQSYYSTGKSLVAITKYLLAHATAISDKPFQTNSNSVYSQCHCSVPYTYHAYDKLLISFIPVVIHRYETVLGPKLRHYALFCMASIHSQKDGPLLYRQ